MGKAKELAELGDKLTVSGSTVTVSGFNYDNIVDSAPGALDTLNELAAAIGDDANFSTTVTNSIATKMSDLVNDTTPQLGGNLDTNGKNIASLTIGGNSQATITRADSSPYDRGFHFSDSILPAVASQPDTSALVGLGSPTYKFKELHTTSLQTTSTGITVTGHIQANQTTTSQYTSYIRNTGDNLQLLLGTTTGGLLNIQGKTISSAAAYKIALQAEGGNVGVGTTGPDQKMHLYTGSGTTLYKAEVNANSTVGLEIKKTGSTTQSWRIVDGETVNGALQFYDVTDSRVSMQIDGSGTLLVGRTADGDGTVGAMIRGTGFIQSTRDGSLAADFNRLSSNGDIIRFQKDSSPVGTIGTGIGSELAISTPSGIQFISQKLTGDTDGVQYSNSGTYHFGPWISKDNAVDLGRSNGGWRDLYLKGGIQFDARSNKLDDYEVGTWTPILTGYSGGTTQTYATQSGNYVKIGRQVIANYSVRLSSKGNISGNYVHIKGLPFNHTGSYAGSGIFNYVISLNTYRDNLGLEMGGSTPDRGWITYMSGTSTSYMTTSDINNGTGFQGTIVYYTS